MPSVGIRPKEVFSAQTRWRMAGMSIEPRVSVPIAAGTRPAATAAAEPELEPPGLVPGKVGLTVCPKRSEKPGGSSVETNPDSSESVVFMKRCAPASLSLATAGASRPAGESSM